MAARRPRIAAAQIALLRKLCEAVGVSGAEAEVRRIVLDEFEPSEGDWRVDPLGNLLITRRGTGPRRLRVMLDAHMDEVGFMIVADDGDGLYQFRTIGGIDPRNLVGKQVVVGRKHAPGVIGAKPIHLLEDSADLKKPIPADTLRIDLGPGGKAEPGDRGTFAPNFRRIGPSIVSKALDDRLGVATSIELVRGAPRNLDILAAFTVQEEIGLRGAKVAANYFKPDLAIVLDATPARDLPMQSDDENTAYNTRLGLGPAIYLSEGSAVDDPRLVRFMIETATKARVPFQLRQPGGGGTNGGAIQRSGIGVPVVSVSVPHRYTHSAASVSRIEDWGNTLALLSAALRRLQRGVLK